MGVLQIYDQQCNLNDYPPNYGTSECKAWDESLTFFGCGTGSLQEPDFCKKKWCYVDLNCTAPDTVFSTINRDIGYSYITCGDMVAGGLDGTEEFREAEELDCEAILAERAAAEAAAAAIPANSILNVPQTAMITVGEGVDA